MLAPVRRGPDRLLLIDEFTGEGEEAFCPEREAEPAGDRPGLAVRAVVLGLVRDGEISTGRHRGHQGADRREPRAVGGGDVAAAAGFAQAQVQHTGDGIGAILRGRTVAKDFNRLHDGRWNGVEVHSR